MEKIEKSSQLFVHSSKKITLRRWFVLNTRLTSIERSDDLIFKLRINLQYLTIKFSTNASFYVIESLVGQLFTKLIEAQNLPTGMRKCDFLMSVGTFGK